MHEMRGYYVYTLSKYIKTYNLQYIEPSFGEVMNQLPSFLSK